MSEIAPIEDNIFLPAVQLLNTAGGDDASTVQVEHEGRQAPSDSHTWICRAIKAEKERDEAQEGFLTALKWCQDMAAAFHQTREERDALRREVASMQKSLARYRETEALQRQIHKSAYTPGEKILLEHVLRQADNPNLERRGELFHLCHQTMAHQLQMSENTIGRSLASFVDTGVLVKKTERRQNPGGQWYDYNYYAPVTEGLRVVHQIPKDETRRERRKHYPCPKCGGEMTPIRLRCTKCGHESSLEDTGHQNDDLLKQEPPHIHTPPPEPAISEAEHQNGDRGRHRCLTCQSDHVRVTDTITCLECGTITVDEAIHDEEGEQPIITGLTLTAQPPRQDDAPTLSRVPAMVPVPKVVLMDIPAFWDETRLKRETAGRLQWGGKDCAAVVEMTGKADPKYIQIKPDAPLTLLDVLAHLEGTRTLAFKAHDAPYSCWFKVETDTPAGVAAYEAALPVLAAAGLPAIIEYSPVHGAGLVKDNGEPKDSAHLNFHFRQVVQVRGFWELLAEIAPAVLRHTDKRWPGAGANMRMPFGKYKQPGLEGWGWGISGVTGETAQGGTPAAWRMLLSHQADHRLVPDLPPESESPAPEPTPRTPNRLPREGVGTGWIPDLPPKEIIDAFNARFTLDDIHPRATRDKAYALDRQEQEPSLHYNDSGPFAGKAHDFGNGQTYDAFELEVQKNWKGNKSAALSHWAKELRPDILARRGGAS